MAFDAIVQASLHQPQPSEQFPRMGAASRCRWLASAPSIKRIDSKRRGAPSKRPGGVCSPLPRNRSIFVHSGGRGSAMAPRARARGTRASCHFWGIVDASRVVRLVALSSCVSRAVASDIGQRAPPDPGAHCRTVASAIGSGSALELIADATVAP